MQLEVDSDAAFLVLPKVHSHIAGNFKLLHHNSATHKYHDNAPILIECKTLRTVVTCAAEAETHGVFQNAKHILPIRYMLEQMNHPQSRPTPLKTDNSTADGFVKNNIQMKKSKAWDMQLHWLRDKENHNFFNVFWDKGTNNDADYFTKHHPTVHH